MKVLIIGCGYVGLEIGRQLTHQGHQVFGIKRTIDPEMAEAGIAPIIGDATQEHFWAQLKPEFDWVVNCLSSGRGDATVYKSVYRDTNRHLIHWLHNTRTQKYVYTSSTSVLGYQDGSVVDENTPILPLTDASEILKETEELLLDGFHSKSVPAIVVRLSGIYGPGRGFLFKQFIENKATLSEGGTRHINMIHRDDAASGVIASLLKGSPGEIYHISDSQPVTQLEFFRFLSNELNRPVPPLADSEKKLKRAPTNKIVSNEKALEQLDWTLKFPTFKEGYKPEIEKELAKKSESED